MTYPLKINITCLWCQQVISNDFTHYNFYSICKNHFYEGSPVQIYYYTLVSDVFYKNETDAKAPVITVTAINILNKRINLYANLNVYNGYGSSYEDRGVKFHSPAIENDPSPFKVIWMLSNPIESILKRVNNMMAFL